MRIVLINPNTNTNTTAAMVTIAEEAGEGAVRVEGMTACFGVPLITTPAELATAAEAVVAMAGDISARAPDAVIVSAFGDPGLEDLRSRLTCTVTGIAEAAMEEASARGRAFAVATTTPHLVDSITARAFAYGHASLFRGVFLTRGDIHALMQDPRRLEDELVHACERAVTEANAKAIIIGGGPLAQAARTIRNLLRIDIIEPIPSALRKALHTKAMSGVGVSDGWPRSG